MWKTFHKFAKMSTKKQQKVFSESFKRAKVALIEAGQATTTSIAEQFDLSYVAVMKWVHKFGKVSRPDRIVIETDSDYKKLIEVLKENKNLERLVGKQQIKIDYYEELIKEIKNEYGEDIVSKFLKK